MMQASREATDTQRQEMFSQVCHLELPCYQLCVEQFDQETPVKTPWRQVNIAITREHGYFRRIVHFHMYFFFAYPLV